MTEVEAIETVYKEAKDGKFDGIEYANIRDWWPGSGGISPGCCQACKRYTALMEGK
jgi:hypothetical protein